MNGVGQGPRPIPALEELEAEVARHIPERDKGPLRGDDALRTASFLLRRYAREKTQL